MIFFDYLYYSIFKFYASYKEKGAASTSAGIVGGFQAMNVLSLVLLVQLINIENATLNKLLVIVVFIIFQITTWRRYLYKSNHSVDVVEKEWYSKTETSRKKITFWLFLYSLGSIITFFALAIYIALH